MYRPAQLKLFRFPASSSAYGGSITERKRKTARPVSLKEAMHVVMRAETARDTRSLLLPKNARLFHDLLTRYGKRFEVKIYRFAFVGNHVHLLVKARTKLGFQNFLRVVAGQSAQKITGAKPGSALLRRFWDLLAYSRIVTWGKAYETAKRYIDKNVREGAAILRVSRLKNSS